MNELELSLAVWVTLGVLTVISLGIMLLALVDLGRHEVRHLPKWGWALIVLLVSFPLGVILYFVLGRVPERPAAAPARTPAPAPAATFALPETLDPPAAAPGIAAASLVLGSTALTKTYRDTTALAGVDLAVPAGSTYGLIGPNGAGKTTLLSLLAGLRRPTAGSVTLGVPRHQLAVLVDTPHFDPWLTAYEVTDLARHLTAPAAPGDRVAQALAEVGLAEVAHRRVGGFSRGMLQRLGLAACLVGDPRVLVLDEPASALDPAGRREVLDLIGGLAGSRTILLSTHILADVQQVCDTVGVIDQGRMRYQGPLSDLLARASTTYLLQVRPPAEALIEELRRQPWLTEVTQSAPGRLRMLVSDAGRAETETPRLLAAHGQALVGFAPAADLETAFLELTS